VPVREVSDYTGFPEMMDGRIKTLHPRCTAASSRCATRRAHRRMASTASRPSTWWW
jgi:AICAR transformylase/IMP cyclohydrolase PurH